MGNTDKEILKKMQEAETQAQVSSKKLNPKKTEFPLGVDTGNNANQQS